MEKFKELYKEIQDWYFRILSEYNNPDTNNPEILSSIFENLLASYSKGVLRKATGSFYTPKEIADYMINETLKEYFKEKIPILTQEELNNLLSPSNEVLEFEENKRNEIIKAIYDLKVIDPACGSGNFLVSFLLKLLHILKKLNYNDNLTNLVKCIYGVDILPLAIQIAKLRLFLLFKQNEILDYLNTNLICANTLLNFEKDNYFDIVITNPPYVRQEKIVDIKKNLINYEVYTPTADLYVYFYEKGMKLLKEKGILSYITSNKWLRAKYGEKLRDYLKNYKVLKIIDFGGYRVFKQTIDTNIIIIKKEKSNGNIVKFLEVSKDVKKEDLISYINDIKNWNELKQSKLNKTGWILTKDEVLKLKEKIERIGKPLKDWDIKILAGIKTGYNEAFIIDNETRNRILSSCKDEEERKRTQELIKPILRGRDIGKYYYKWAGLWIILIPSGWTKKNCKDKNYEEWFKNNYTSLYNHLSQYKNKENKEGRNIINRPSQGDFWWEIRSGNYFESEKVKIISQDITNKPKFAYDENNYYITNGYIITGENLKYLLGVLNSNLTYWYMLNTSWTLSNNSLRWLKEFIKRIPIPPTDISKNIIKEIVKKVDNILYYTISENYEVDKEKTLIVKELEEEINKLVYKLYDLTEDEIKIIEESKGDIGDIKEDIKGT